MPLFERFDRDTQHRWQQLVTTIDLPLVPNDTYQSILYVGANFTNFQFYRELSIIFRKITVIEIYPLYFHQVKFLPNVEPILGDIRSFAPGRTWDLVMWWHGCEHLVKTEVFPVIRNLETLANKLVILGCPWGKTPAYALHGNDWNEHKSQWYPSDFQELGYQTKTLGIPDLKPVEVKVNVLNNILAWKYVRHDRE